MPDPNQGSVSRKLTDYLDLGDEIPTGSHQKRDPDPTPQVPTAEPSIHLLDEDLQENTGTGAVELGTGEIELVSESSSGGFEDDTLSGKKRGRHKDPDDIF
jgi:hypothetical protein